VRTASRPDAPVPAAPPPARSAVTAADRPGRAKATASRPARFSDALAYREFRWLLVADVLSLLGDQLTKVAAAALAWERTGSATLAAATFALGYLPYLLGGTLLAALADRLPRRSVMVACDLARAGLVGLLAVPGVPLPVLYAVLFAAALLTPPFASARSATVPDILPGDTYVAGNALVHTIFGLGQVLGLLAGGLVVGAVGVHGALGVDAATFLASALVVRTCLSPRPAVHRETPSGSLLADTGEALRLVAGDPVLRSLLLLAWLGAAFGVVPEGLAVVVVAEAGGGPVLLGLVIAALPAGATVGSLAFARLVHPDLRLRLVLPVCLAGFLPLLATPLAPSLPVVAALWFLTGVSACFQLAANAAFVRAVPPGVRGRAFGIAQAGLLTAQGLSLLAAGALAEVWDPTRVVAGFGWAGLVAVGALAAVWPSARLARLTQPTA
jgi:MFS family permease